MINSYLIRNICIGLIDGLIIPLAVTAGLTQFPLSASTVIAVCLTIGVAGAFTMGIGGFMEAGKYEPQRSPFRSSITIGVSYLAGSVLVALPYYFLPDANQPLYWSIVIALTLIAVAGYIEASIHGSKGWQGAVRVLAVAVLATVSAMYLARLFD